MSVMCYFVAKSNCNHEMCKKLKKVKHKIRYISILEEESKKKVPKLKKKYIDEYNELLDKLKHSEYISSPVELALHDSTLNLEYVNNIIAQKNED